MPNEIPKHSADEMTPALRKALVEVGALIPTTEEEVKLAEPHLKRSPTANEVNASFERLEQMLDDDLPASSFMRLHECVLPASEEEFALAARNGTKLDAETLAKIEASVDRAVRKPTQA